MSKQRQGYDRDAVSKWRQSGEIYLWQYRRVGGSLQGWHFSGNPEGCRSLFNLLTRMQGGEACYRTLRLGVATSDICAVPTGIKKVRGQFTRLKVQYVPGGSELKIAEDTERLVLAFGLNQLRKLASSIAQVEAGHGDFSIKASVEGAASSLWFWWLGKHR